MFYIIIVGVLAYAFGAFDGTKIKHEEYIDSDGHRWRFLLRAFTIICLALTSYYGSIIELGLFTVILGTVFWIVLDITIALIIGESWHYLGDTAKTDKFFKGNIGEYYTFFFKLAILIASSIGYLMI